MDKDTQVENLIYTEERVLNQLKNEHRPYFDALMYAISVLVDRNHKYTGDEEKRDVFANFELDAKIQGIETQETFKQWVAKKTARIMINDKDYGDESFTDSLRDLVNYSLLWIGYIFQQKTVPIDSEGMNLAQESVNPIIILTTGEELKRTGVGHTDYSPENTVLVNDKEVPESQAKEMLKEAGVDSSDYSVEHGSGLVKVKHNRMHWVEDETNSP